MLKHSYELGYATAMEKIAVGRFISGFRSAGNSVSKAFAPIKPTKSIGDPKKINTRPKSSSLAPKPL